MFWVHSQIPIFFPIGKSKGAGPKRGNKLLSPLLFPGLDIFWRDKCDGPDRTCEQKDTYMGQFHWGMIPVSTVLVPQTRPIRKCHLVFGVPGNRLFAVGSLVKSLKGLNTAAAVGPTNHWVPLTSWGIPTGTWPNERPTAQWPILFSLVSPQRELASDLFCFLLSPYKRPLPLFKENDASSSSSWDFCMAQLLSPIFKV